MSVRTYAAAKLICELGGWRVSNLALQKIMYVSHMIHMGTHGGAPLIKPDFEAWDYGPVVPALYQHCKAFGAKPVENVFTAEPSIEGTPEAKTINIVCGHLLSRTPGQLVALTHWEGGAWAKNYQPGIRGIVIPREDILNEYRNRAAKIDSSHQRAAT